MPSDESKQPTVRYSVNWGAVSIAIVAIVNGAMATNQFLSGGDVIGYINATVIAIFWMLAINSDNPVIERKVSMGANHVE